MVIEDVAKHMPADGKVWITTQGIIIFSMEANKIEFTLSLVCWKIDSNN